MSKVKEEFAKFGKNTSVAGISRIFNTKEIFLKVLWTFFLLVCTALLVYFLVTLFVEYFKWPVTTEFGENPKEEIVFPDITICSLNRIINDKKIKPIIKKYFDYFESDYYLSLSLQDQHFLALIYNSLPSFMRNLPKMDILQKDCPNFVAECFLYNTNWQKTLSCESDFKEIWNANYYSCYTIRTSQLKKSRFTVRGMTLVLNNGPPSKVQIPYDISLGSSEGNGVRLAIHGPGTPPDFRKGVTLSPGTENYINIVQTNVERLGKPHNPLGCTNQKYMTNSTSEMYTRDQCIEYCFQDLIYEQCSCVSQFLSIPITLNNVTVCGNTSNVFLFCNLLKDFHSMNCCDTIPGGNENCECFSDYMPNSESLNDVALCANISNSTAARLLIEPIFKESDEILCSINSLRIGRECHKKCQIPCSEKAYSSNLVTSAWPQNSMQLGIYKSYIANCINNFSDVRERYIAYDYVLNRRRNRTKNFSNNQNYSYLDLKEIGESLLVIKLVIEDDFPFMLVDKPMYTWDVIVGVVGGLLSLWLGISAVAIAELFELVYFLIKRCF